jgi:hypothetical protein
VFFPVYHETGGTATGGAFAILPVERLRGAKGFTEKKKAVPRTAERRKRE